MSSPTVVTFQPCSANVGGRDEHGEVRLAARARERGADVGLLAGRVGDAHDQHVLGEPALVAGHRRRDAQREALLAEQGVAAVARAVRPDRPLLGEVDDVLHVGVARPRHVLRGLGSSGAPTVCMHGTNAPSSPSTSMHGAAHAGHDPHVHGDVGGVGDLDADLGDGRAERAHAERDHVHRAAAHAAVEQSPVRISFISVGSIQLLVGPASWRRAAADEGAVLDAGDVARVGAGEEAVRPLLRVQPDEGAGVDELLAEPVVLLVGAVAPVDGVGLGRGRPSRRPRCAVRRCAGWWAVCASACPYRHHRAHAREPVTRVRSSCDPGPDGPVVMTYGHSLRVATAAVRGRMLRRGRARRRSGGRSGCR